MSRVVRISEQAASDLDVLCRTSGDSQQKVMERALKRYLFEQTMKKANEQYAKLRKDAGVAQELDDEVVAWDATLQDGLDDD